MWVRDVIQPNNEAMLKLLEHGNHLDSDELDTQLEKLQERSVGSSKLGRWQQLAQDAPAMKGALLFMSAEKSRPESRSDPSLGLAKGENTK